jgi:hypothetical protein
MSTILLTILSPSLSVILSEAKNLSFARFLVGSEALAKIRQPFFSRSQSLYLFQRGQPCEKIIQTVISNNFIRVVICRMRGLRLKQKRL